MQLPDEFVLVPAPVSAGTRLKCALFLTKPVDSKDNSCRLDTLNTGVLRNLASRIVRSLLTKLNEESFNGRKAFPPFVQELPIHFKGGRMKSIKLLACLLAGLMLFSGIALGQGTGASGSINGTVTDPSGAVLAGATVTATDTERGIKRSISTSNFGRYEIT